MQRSCNYFSYKDRNIIILKGNSPGDYLFPFFVSCRDKTNYSLLPIPLSNMFNWMKEFGDESAKAVYYGLTT